MTEVSTSSDLPFQAEYAKSGRASCKACKTSIEKATLRLAIMVQSHMFDGKSPSWHHFKCFFERARPTAISEIGNIESLRWEDQVKIEKKIQSTLNSKLKSSSAKKDFRLEYSKSGGAKCQICEEKISKGIVRISKKEYNSERAKRYGPYDAWHHISCFSKERENLGFVDSGSTLDGFKTLSKEDQIALKTDLPKIEGKRKIKTEETVSKKIKIDPEMKKEKDEIKKQTKKLFMYRDNLSQLKKKDLDLLLEYNHQGPASGFEKALDRVADIMMFGALNPCPQCKEGQLIFKSTGYSCTGDISEWTKCIYTTKDPQRCHFKVPESLKDLTWLNSYKSNVSLRMISSSAQPSANASENSEPLYKSLKDLKFVLTGQVDVEKLRKIIIRHGGRVLSSVDAKTAAVISDPETCKLETEIILNAKTHNVQVISPELCEKAIGDNIYNYIQKSSLVSWDSDPAIRCRSSKSLSSKGKSEKNIEMSNGTQRLKLKGGGTVDPNSGKENDCYVLKRKDVLYSSVLGAVSIQSRMNSYYKLQVLQHDNKSSSRLFGFFSSNSANKTFRRAVASRIGASKAFKEYLGIYKDWAVRAVIVSSMPTNLAEVVELEDGEGKLDTKGIIEDGNLGFATTDKPIQKAEIFAGIMLATDESLPVVLKHNTCPFCVGANLLGKEPVTLDNKLFGLFDEAIALKYLSNKNGQVINALARKHNAEQHALNGNIDALPYDCSRQDMMRDIRTRVSSSGNIPPIDSDDGALKLQHWENNVPMIESKIMDYPPDGYLMPSSGGTFYYWNDTMEYSLSDNTSEYTSCHSNDINNVNDIPDQVLPIWSSSYDTTSPNTDSSMSKKFFRKCSFLHGLVSAGKRLRNKRSLKEQNSLPIFEPISVEAVIELFGGDSKVEQLERTSQSIFSSPDITNPDDRCNIRECVEISLNEALWASVGYAIDIHKTGSIAQMNERCRSCIIEASDPASNSKLTGVANYAENYSSPGLSLIAQQATKMSVDWIRPALKVALLEMLREKPFMQPTGLSYVQSKRQMPKVNVYSNRNTENWEYEAFAMTFRAASVVMRQGLTIGSPEGNVNKDVSDLRTGSFCFTSAGLGKDQDTYLAMNVLPLLSHPLGGTESFFNLVDDETDNKVKVGSFLHRAGLVDIRESVSVVIFIVPDSVSGKIKIHDTEIEVIDVDNRKRQTIRPGPVNINDVIEFWFFLLMDYQGSLKSLWCRTIGIFNDFDWAQVDLIATTLTLAWKRRAEYGYAAVGREFAQINNNTTTGEESCVNSLDMIFSPRNISIYSPFVYIGAWGPEVQLGIVAGLLDILPTSHESQSSSDIARASGSVGQWLRGRLLRRLIEEFKLGFGFKDAVLNYRNIRHDNQSVAAILYEMICKGGEYDRFTSMIISSNVDWSWSINLSETYGTLPSSTGIRTAPDLWINTITCGPPVGLKMEDFNYELSFADGNPLNDKFMYGDRAEVNEAQSCVNLQRYLMSVDQHLLNLVMHDPYNGGRVAGRMPYIEIDAFKESHVNLKGGWLGTQAPFKERIMGWGGSIYVRDVHRLRILRAAFTYANSIMINTTIPTVKGRWYMAQKTSVTYGTLMGI